MSLIPCDDQCIYQKDGYCTLETPTVVTNHSGGCIHCIRPADKSQANANEPNITLPRLFTPISSSPKRPESERDFRL